MQLRDSVLLATAAVVFGWSGVAAAGQAVAPTSNLRVAMNASFRLCPALVRGVTPDAATLTSLGLTAAPAARPGDLRFDGRADVDLLRVVYEAGERRCTVHYAGGGFSAVAGAARAMMARNGLNRLTGGVEGGAAGDVFEGPAPAGGAIGRFIVIENSASRSAAVSYTERTGR